jgi:hypothetical protein
MNIKQRKAIATFATAYSAMGDALAKEDMGSYRVWRDIYVAAADVLGMKDEDHLGLGDARRAQRAADEAFAENYRNSLAG